MARFTKAQVPGLGCGNCLMIKAILYLSNSDPITIEAENEDELVCILSEYDRRNLVAMLAQAIKQLDKRDKQVMALEALASKIQ